MGVRVAKNRKIVKILKIDPSQNPKNGIFALFPFFRRGKLVDFGRKMAVNPSKSVKNSIFRLFRLFLACSAYFREKKFFHDFSNFFFSQYAFFFSTSTGPKTAKSAENPIFCVLTEAKMGVRVTKNRKKIENRQIHPRPPM